MGFTMGGRLVLLFGDSSLLPQQMLLLPEFSGKLERERGSGVEFGVLPEVGVAFIEELLGERRECGSSPGHCEEEEVEASRSLRQLFQVGSKITPVLF